MAGPIEDKGGGDRAVGSSITRSLIKLAVAWLPRSQRERFGEEWQSHVDEVPGKVGKLLCCVGFLFAAYNMALTTRRDRLRSRFERGLIADIQFVAYNMAQSTRRDRLRSRFERLIADIQPDLETKVPILQKKAEPLEITMERLEITKQLKATIPDDVALYVAQNIPSNRRELALDWLVVYSAVIGTKITLPYAKRMLKSCGLAPRKITIESIRKMVARARMRVFPKPGRRKRP